LEKAKAIPNPLSCLDKKFAVWFKKKIVRKKLKF
jgi:hypothetical protein